MLEWTAAELVSPIEAFESFRFESLLIDDPDTEPDGLATTGVAITPDALTCKLANPVYFMNPVFAEAFALGDQFWLEDGFGSVGLPSDRADDYAIDALVVCPGAREFWEEPFFLTEPFILTYVGPDEQIAGVPTGRFSVSTDDSPVDLSEGSVWITEDGVPIRVRLAGHIEGGVFALVAPDDEDLLTDRIPFEYHLDIFDIDVGSLMVRSPDGSVSAGPLGPIVSSIEPPPRPSPALAEKIDEAMDTDCVRFPTFRKQGQGITTDLTAFEFTDTAARFEDLQLGTVFTRTEAGPLASQNYSGMQYGGWPIVPVQTGATEDVARMHAMLLFNHRAPLLALADLLGLAPDAWLLDGQPAVVIETTDGTLSSDSTGFARWDGYDVYFADGTVEAFEYPVFLAVGAPELAPSRAVVAEARVRLEDWTAAATDIVDGLPTGDLQAAANLRDLFDKQTETRALACIVLADDWITSAKAFQSGTMTTSELVPEVALQHLLLAMEYVDILGVYLQQPDIDWLRGDQVDMSTPFLGPDTTGTVVNFFTGLLEEALLFADPEFDFYDSFSP